MNNYCMRWLCRIAPLVIAGSLAAAPFQPLFRVVSPKGPCHALVPGTDGYVPVQKGKAYPFGTAIRCGENGGAVLVLSESDAIQLDAGTTVELAEDPGNRSRKILRLRAGRLGTRLSSGNQPEALTIETPVAACLNMVGTIKLALAATAAGSTLSVQADSSSTVKVVGPQFIVPELKNGMGARIVTAGDNSLTRIENLLGDYMVMINKGTDEDAPEMVDGAANQDLLPIATSTRMAVKIWRSRAPVGGRLIVSALASDANGKVTETYAFAVGQPNIASRAVFEDAELAAATNAAAPTAAAGAGDAPQAEKPSGTPPATGTVEDLF